MFFLRKDIMSDKLKINYVELTGNLVQDAKVIGKAVFLTVATYNGKNKEGQERPATFTDVAIFNPKSQELKKGQRVNIKGNLTNYKDKDTGYTKLGVVALSCKLLSKTEESVVDKLLKESGIDDIPWEMEL